MSYHYITFNKFRHGRLAFANMMSARVAALDDRLFLEKAMPTLENRRSTEADVAGQPKYWRAITSKFGNSLRFSIHQSVASFSVLYLICGSARYLASSLSGAGVSSTSSSDSSEDSAKKPAALVLRRFRWRWLGWKLDAPAVPESDCTFASLQQSC